MDEQEKLENIIIEWLSIEYTDTWNRFTTGFHRYNARDLITMFSDQGYELVKKGDHPWSECCDKNVADNSEAW